MADKRGRRGLGTRARGSRSPVLSGSRRRHGAMTWTWLMDQTCHRCLPGRCRGAGGRWTGHRSVTARSADPRPDLARAARGHRRSPSAGVQGRRMRTMHVLELTFWNDAPERTRTDVLNLLQRAQENSQPPAAQVPGRASRPHCRVAAPFACLREVTTRQVSNTKGRSGPQEAAAAREQRTNAHAVRVFGGRTAVAGAWLSVEGLLGSGGTQTG